MDARDLKRQMKYEISGAGEALVLVPGGLTGWLSWIPHAEQLSATRRVIRLQLLSVDAGLQNVPLPDGYQLETELVALRQTLDALEIEQADVAGWSYGAEIALSFAIHSPHRVRTLTLIEPASLWVLDSRGVVSPELLDEQRMMQSLAGDDVSEEQLVWFTQFAGFVPADVDPRTLPQWQVWMQHRQSLRMGDAPFRHKDSIELVRAFQKPVLLVKGERSKAYYYDIIDILADEFPDARVVSYPGGHAPHIISMQPFMEQFTTFLSTARDAS